MTHTQTSTDCGPDFCDECSRAAQEWVRWPCDQSGRGASTSTTKITGHRLSDRLIEAAQEDEGRVTTPCEASVGPIWKLDGETCGCKKPADHDLRDGHDCPCGSWWADPSTVKP